MQERENSGFWADWFKTVFLEDSENGGKGEMQERIEPLCICHLKSRKRRFDHRKAIFVFFDPGRIVVFLISNAEISCQSILPPFPARTFHAQLPL